MAQLPIFTPPPPDANDRLNAAQAKMRVERQAREGTRARSEPMTAIKRRLKVVGRELARLEEIDPLPPRPKTRADCINGPRPCPWVGCRHHLYLDVSTKTGSLKTNFPDVDEVDLEKLRETCALDVAARGGVGLKEIAEYMNLTKERVRQIEVLVIPKFKAAVESQPELMEHVVGPPSSRKAVDPDFDPDDFAGERLDE